MIDFAGLIQPEVASQLAEQATCDDDALWAIRHLPDYVLPQEGALPQVEQQTTSGDCRLVRRFAGEPYGFRDNVRVYLCPR